MIEDPPVVDDEPIQSIEYDNDLLNHIKSNDLYISKIIKMIPRELYKPPTVDPIVTNSKYHKHRRLPLEPDSRKLLSKQKKQSKYDPNYTGGDNDDDSVQSNDQDDEDNQNEKSNNIVNLKKRLNEKIENLKRNREIKSDKGNKIDVSEKVHQTKPKQLKVSPHPANNSKHIREQLMLIETEDISTINPRIELESNLDSTTDSTDIETAATDISYNLATGDNNRILPKDFGKPGSKSKRLHSMLAEVEKKRQRLQDLKQSGPEGKEKLQQELWEGAIKSAAGEKIINDPKVIKNKLKKIEKNKAKSAKEWNARLKDVEKAKKTKQETREMNLLKRKNKDKESIAKESTSVVKPRPGFEGKKTDILNKKTDVNNKSKEEKK